MAALQYIQRKDIDTARWDTCIDEAPNGLIYAYVCYLDKMAKHWDALVLGDYEAVMPLTWNKKWNISYLYQPPFTASLGIFGKLLTEEIVRAFIAAIPVHFKLIEINLNYGNILSASSGFSILRNNYTLSLHKSYDELYKGYRENIRRNVRKAIQLNCRYETGIDINAILQLSHEQMGKVASISEEDFNNFRDLYQQLLTKGQALSCGVYSPDGMLIASCVYFFSHQRAYYILVGNHPDGRTIGASHFLIDRFIHDHAGQDLLLDFEGSDIRNVAFFYSSFGAVAEIYPALHINRLPWYVKWMK